MDIVDLKRIREARGLSLWNVYEKIRISVNNLDALERGDFGTLPPAIYARKFIRDYADFLGQDSSRLLGEYENYLASLCPPVVDPVSRTDTGKEEKPTAPKYKFPRRTFAFLAAGLILVLLGYLALSDFGKQPVEDAKIFPAAPPAVEDNPVTKDQPVPPESKTEITKDAAPPAQTPPGGAQHLAIEARELTWLRIRSDKNPPQQLLMNPGERIERYAEQYFIIDIGNAGGVALSLQGKPLGSLGKSGEVVHLRLP
ncbi:MAG: DUF4115 domain-containing protein [Smithellaceae bacterium]|nr:DUF4115 domain-containing protein [Smithellaceae bacterium]